MPRFDGSDGFFDAPRPGEGAEAPGRAAGLWTSRETACYGTKSMALGEALRLASSLAAACAVVLAAFPCSAAEPEHRHWCAPELEALTDAACYVAEPPPEACPPATAPGEQDAAGPSPAPQGSAASVAPAAHGTLVIFLHSLVGAGSRWQWEQQRVMARAGKKLGFAVLMPRGRVGIGPGRSPDVWAWPTSVAMQEQYETALLDEWTALKRTLEARRGPFARVFVFGFSNGAYYAASLAVRAKLPVQGYGVFAGGSGGKYMRLLAARTRPRVPVFVGYGTKDPAHHDQEALVALLADLGWKHRSKAAPVGHVVTDAQIAAAFHFLQAS
jgi:predicted esterase